MKPPPSSDPERVGTGLRLFGAWILTSIIAGFLFVDPWATSYYFLWIVCLGSLFYRKRDYLKARFDNIPIPSKPRFVLIGMGMILIEETLVGILTPLAEGQGLAAIPRRVLQQQIFNLLALGPILVLWAFLLWRYAFSVLTVMFLSGIFGAVMYEGALDLFADTLVGLWALPLLITAHALIYYLPYLSAEPIVARSRRHWLQWPILIGGFILAYVVTGFALSVIQETLPFLIPGNASDRP
jgi:hypothetical protein